MYREINLTTAFLKSAYLHAHDRLLHLNGLNDEGLTELLQTGITLDALCRTAPTQIGHLSGVAGFAVVQIVDHLLP